MHRKFNNKIQKVKKTKLNRCEYDYECPIHKKMVEEAKNNQAFHQEAGKGDSKALQCPRESPPPSPANEDPCGGKSKWIIIKFIPIVSLRQGEQTVPTWVIVVALVLILLSIGISELRWHRLIKALRHPADK